MSCILTNRDLDEGVEADVEFVTVEEYVREESPYLSTVEWIVVEVGAETFGEQRNVIVKWFRFQSEQDEDINGIDHFALKDHTTLTTYMSLQSRQMA